MPAVPLSYRVGRCYAMFFLVYLATALILAFTWPGGGIDETAHLSFIMAESANPQLFPRYEALPMLAEGSLATFGDGVNYLNHPSFYYLLLSLFVVPELAPETQMLVFRLVNMAISAAAVVLLFALSARLFTRYREHFVFAAVIVLTPKVGGTSGLISNDNLALLASALTFLGFVALHRREATARTATLLGAGFALAALSKLTAGLMLGLVILFGHLRQWRRFAAPDRALLGYLGLLLVFVLNGLSPYLANLAHYGSPIYVDREFLAGHEDSLVYRDDAGRHFLSSPQYLQLFLFEMVCRWSTLEGSDFFEILTILLLVGLALFGLWACGARAASRRRRQSPVPACWRPRSCCRSTSGSSTEPILRPASGPAATSATTCRCGRPWRWRSRC